MTRFTLHVPEQLNNGAAVSESYFRTVEQDIEDVAGGWTLTHGIGGWRGEDTRYREPVRLYAVDVDTADSAVGYLLQDIARRVATTLDQEAVYLTAQDIAPTFIYPSRVPA